MAGPGRPDNLNFKGLTDLIRFRGMAERNRPYYYVGRISVLVCQKNEVLD